MRNIASSSIIGAKIVNEDSLRIKTKGAVRVCVADGHWGSRAAQDIATFWYKLGTFPATRTSAIFATQSTEEQLHDMFGSPNMDTEKDWTPEAAFVAVELRNDLLTFVSYGDCRLMVVRNNKIIARNEIHATWLGAFSHRGLRERQSVFESLEFGQLRISTGDTILMYSDGVDECVYEVPTIPDQFFIETCKLNTAQQVHDRIMAEVQSHGAEDNATLAVIKI